VDRRRFVCVLGGADATTLFIAAAEWRGMSELVSPGTGQVLIFPVSVPLSGWP
jgi:hypothetical protein